MGSQTANLALPYPVGTDLIADGDNAIQALAERVDSLLWSGFGTAAPWIAVGSGGTAPGFGAGFANYLGGFTPVGFRKIGNLVYLRGLITNTANTAVGAPMFTLPVGYRPTGTLILAGISAGGSIRIDVATNGVISAPTAALTTGTFTSLTLPPFAVD